MFILNSILAHFLVCKRPSNINYHFLVAIDGFVVVNNSQNNLVSVLLSTNSWNFLYIFRSDIDTLQFQMTFEIPHIRVKAQYRSSGVLILVKASGAGDYWGEYGKMNRINLSIRAFTAVN